MYQEVFPEACPDPRCFPESADPRKYTLKFCWRHEPEVTGSDDGAMPDESRSFLASGTDASGGETGRGFAKLLGKKKRSRRRRR